MAGEIERDDAPARGDERTVLDVSPDFGAGRVAVYEEKDWSAVLHVGVGYADQAVVCGEGETLVWHSGVRGDAESFACRRRRFALLVCLTCVLYGAFGLVRVYTAHLDLCCCVRWAIEAT